MNFAIKLTSERAIMPLWLYEDRCLGPLVDEAKRFPSQEEARSHIESLPNLSQYSGQFEVVPV